MLCSQTDVEQRLQIDFTSDPDAVCAALIAAAQGHIEREVGRPIEADDYTETVDGPTGAYLWLNNTPVNSIASVTVDGSALTVATDIYFTDYGKLGRINDDGYLTRWGTYKPHIVTVVYNGGYTTVPLDLRDLCANVAARAFQAGAAFAALPAAAGSGAIRSVALSGSDSVEFAEGAASGLATMSVTRPVQFTPEEIDICRYYRLVNVA